MLPIPSLPIRLTLLVVFLVAICIFVSIQSASGVRRHPETLRATSASAPVVPPEPYRPTGLVYVATDAPCAKDRDTNATVLRAIREKDGEAVAGLLERGKIFLLTKGTRFEVSDNDGFAWGFVRSGRNTGETCYILSGALRSTP